MIVPDKVVIDILTCQMSLGEVMAYIETYQKEHPEYEVFVDGDAHAIVARQRPVKSCKLVEYSPVTRRVVIE